MRVLALTALLYTSITVAQTFGAVIANSSALLADCVAGYVDSGTSFANMLAESRKGTRCHRIMQLTIPVISLSLLSYFTLEVMLEAVEKLGPDREEEEDDTVNPYIVVFFSLWGLIFGIVALVAFIRNMRAGNAEVNMLAVFVHVAADFARSLATLAESVLLFCVDWDEVAVDAWACIVVSVSILCAAVYALYEWWSELREFCRTGE